MQAGMNVGGWGACSRWVVAAAVLAGCGDDTSVVTDSSGNSGSTTGGATESAGVTTGVSASMSGDTGEHDGSGSATTTDATTSGSGGASMGRTQGSDETGSSSGELSAGGGSSGSTSMASGSGSEAGTGSDTEAETDGGESTGGEGNGSSGECPAGELAAFSDGFTADLGQWVLDPKWAYADGADWGQLAGDGVMASAWNVGGGGCPTTQRVVMTDAVSLGDVATLRFAHAGELANLDTLRVIASTDDGLTWQEVEAYDDMTGPGAVETVVEVDVSAFAGGDVRFGFEYDNVCGDPLGVTWVLDDVVVCEPAPPESCADGQFAAYVEDFEVDDGDWILGTHWAYADGLDFAQPGDGVMAGIWDTLGFDGGCPTTQRVELADPVALFGNATLGFSQAAQLSTNDTLRVLASSDDGATWQVVGEYDDTAGLTLLAESDELIDIATVAAAGPVRVAFEFENICGDALGVEWGVDDVVLCSDPPPAGACGDAFTTLFEEDFESDDGAWVLGTHWSYTDGADFAQAGDGVMAGIWDTLGTGAGCPTTQRVEMANTVVAGGVVSLRFSQAAQLSTNDTLRVLVSTDDGVTWETVTEYDDTDGLLQNVETMVELDLTPWSGPIRIAFEFDNVCGDAFGVEWGLDDVLLCEQSVLPT